MATALLVAGGVALLVGFALGIMLHFNWPEWLRGGHEWEQLEKFVAPILVGSYVGLVFALIQIATQIDLHRSDQHAQAIEQKLAAREQSAEQKLADRQQLILQLNLNEDLRGIDLSDQNLRDLYLRGKDLEYANLRGAQLSGADLEDANLNGADLTGANAENVNFEHAHLDDTTVVGTNFSGSDFSNAHVEWIALVAGSPSDMPTFNYATFSNTADLISLSANARGAIIDTFSGSLFFIASNLSGATLWEQPQSGQGVWFCWSNLSNTRLLGDFNGALFGGSDLSDETVLNDSSFVDADMRSTGLLGIHFVPTLTFTEVGTLGTSAESVGNEVPGNRTGTPDFAGARYDVATQGSALLREHGGQLWSLLGPRDTCEDSVHGAPGHPIQ